jgi:hypothetical protein
LRKIDARLTSVDTASQVTTSPTVTEQRLELNNYAYFGAFALWAIATLYIFPAQFLAGITFDCFAVPSQSLSSACSLSFWTLQT